MPRLTTVVLLADALGPFTVTVAGTTEYGTMQSSLVLDTQEEVTVFFDKFDDTTPLRTMRWDIFAANGEQVIVDKVERASWVS